VSSRRYDESATAKKPQGRNGAVRRLTREEERDLILRIRDGDRRAMDTLILANLGFVAKVASRYAGNSVPAEDLLNEGTLGLIEAARRYDPERRLRFLTYAVFWVRRSILAALKLYSSPIRIPESQRRRANRETGTAPLTVRAAPKPPHVLPIDRTSRMHSDMLAAGPVSLDQKLGPTTENVLGDILEDRGPDDAEELLLRRETAEALENGMVELTESERYVLHHRFGFGGAQRRTLEELGDEMGVTRERVRQIELRGRNKLGRLLRRKSISEEMRRLRRPRG
jgi:RNA polymerase primary sigma factor